MHCDSDTDTCAQSLIDCYLLCLLLSAILYQFTLIISFMTYLTILHLSFAILQEWKSNTMVVKNIGQVLSSWQFVPKFDETVISMPWLSFNPMKGILAPGEVELLLCFRINHTESSSWSCEDRMASIKYYFFAPWNTI
jgi:hypothetical protein